LLADDFSHIPDKATIRPTVVFSFTTLCATNLNNKNLIIVKALRLSRAITKKKKKKKKKNKRKEKKKEKKKEKEKEKEDDFQTFSSTAFNQNAKLKT
jgi:flagellar biosynthesis component FlhA